MDNLVWSRFVTLGPVSASPGSRAFLAYENGPDGPLWPVVVVWVPEDVVADPDRLAALQLDTDRAVLLDHPNVNRVVGCEKLPEGWARVVELANGETMRRVLQSSKGLGRPAMEPRVVARIMADTATGTHYVHERGKVEGSVRWRLHGSIKPETVIVGFDGTSKITGYGANEVAPRDTFGPTATLRSQYLSPEEIERGAEVTDRRSDVYALGLVLYEALAGRPPWATDDPKFEYKVLSEPLPLEPLEQVPAPLKDIVVKALSRLPASRYATAGALAEAIEATGPAPAAEVAAEMARLFPPDSPERAKRRDVLAAAGFPGEKLPRPQPKARPKPAPSKPTPVAIPAAPPSPAPAPAPAPRRGGGGWIVLGIVGAAAAGVAAFYLLPQHPHPMAAPAPEKLATKAVAPPPPPAAVPVPPPVPAPAAPVAAPPAPKPPPELPTGFLPPSTPTPPPLEPGRVELASEPSGLSVSVDGEAKGQTPETLDVEPGSHSVRFRDRSKGIDVTRSVTLKPGGHEAVSVRLAHAGMEVTAPLGSQVFLDGKSVGVAPVGTLRFYAGHHVIKVKMTKSVFERPFDADPDETLTLNVEPGDER